MPRVVASEPLTPPPDAEAERRRDEALRRALNTPPQHRVKPKPESNPLRSLAPPQRLYD